jgi:diguanylate cyclase (GGDEF)-like protein/PAS domain S-box-containing protein
MTRGHLHKLSPKDELDDPSLLRILIESLPDQAYVKDTESRYVLNNVAHVRALGASSPDEVAGKTDADFYPEEIAERYRADEQEILLSGRPLIDREEPGEDEEGNRRWHSITKVPLRDGDGKIMGLLGITRNITERKETEEAIQRGGARFRAVFDRAAIGMALVNREGRIVESNPALREMLGYRGEDLGGMHFSEVTHPDDVAPDVERFEELMAGEIDHFRLEKRYVRKDGSLMWGYLTSSSIRSDDDRPQLMIGMVEDITARKKAQEDLKKSEERHRAVVEQSIEGIYLFNPHTGRLLESNNAFQKLLGYSPDELLEMTIYDFIAHEREDIDYNVRRDHQERRRDKGERKYLRKDGSLVDVEASASVVPYGEEEALCCVVHDVTERKEAEEALRCLAEFERLITTISAGFIDVAPGEIDAEIDDALRAIGEFVGVDRSFVFLFSRDGAKMDNTHEWCAEGVEPQRDNLKGLPVGDLPWVMRRLRTLEAIHVPSVDDLPVQASAEKEYFRSREIQSFLVIPMVYKRSLVGFVGFDSVKGERIWTEETIALLKMAGDMFVNVLKREWAEEALRESEERFRTAFEDAPIGVALVSLDMRYLRVNHALCEMLGYSEEEMLEKTSTELVHPEDHEISAQLARQAIEKGLDTYIIERRYVCADGHVAWNLVSVSLIRDSEGEPSHFVCLHQDITERKELEERLEHQAFHDSLTGLPNRALFLDRLGHALARTEREGSSTAVLLLDLDDFKVVNDSLGHAAGNTVLVEVAQRLRDSVRPGDTVARIFGDEFAVLLEAPAGVAEASRVALRVQECLQEPFDLEGQEVFISSTIGIALGETAEHQSEEVLRHADLAMYEAKRKGKAQYEVYASGMNHRAVERMDLESDLRRAVERQEFEVHYQPKVLLKTGEIVGVEALVRWQHPDRGLLWPDQFIPLAEETGLIDQIGLWVMKESCRQVKEWQERYPAKLDLPLGLCVNLSAREIQQHDLAGKVAGVLQETRLDLSCLMLEIPESTAIEEAEQTIAKLRQLKDLNVELAIDDFGTGYCSLVYLEHSLLDVLKIDRLLVHRERKDPKECETIISAMTSMAHSLGLTVVVEGIETEDQLAKLKEIGCEMAQGYCFAKPLPAEAIERLLVEDGPW